MKDRKILIWKISFPKTASHKRAAHGKKVTVQAEENPQLSIGSTATLMILTTVQTTQKKLRVSRIQMDPATFLILDLPLVACRKSFSTPSDIRGSGVTLSPMAGQCGEVTRSK